MTELLSALLNISIATFAVASMLAVGFGHSVGALVGPLRNVLAVFRVLVANFVLVPILGVALIRLFDLDLSVAIGLFLVSAAAGAPFLIKLTLHAEHDVGLSATLLVLLIAGTIVFLPLVIPLVLPDAAVSAGAIARPLLLTMLLPLAAGLALRAVAEPVATRLRPLTGPIASTSLIVLIATTALLNLRGIVGIGLGPVAAAVLLILGAFGAGYAMSGGDREARGVVGLATAQRNVAAATIVATQSVSDRPATLIIVVVASLVGMAILFPIGTVLRRRLASRTPSPPDAVPAGAAGTR